MPRHPSAPPAGDSLSAAPVASDPRTAFEAPSNALRAPCVARVGVGYLRRSTDRQEQSIGDQRAAVERFAAERGIRLLRHYVDDGISGTSTAGRRAFQQLIGDAERNAKDRHARGAQQKVIEEVIKAHRPFMGRKGRQRLEQAMLEARGGELTETREARRRASQRLEEIAAQARTLLDNLSEANRVFVDERLRELTREREELERRVESLDRLAMSDREFQEAVREQHGMIEQLDRVLECGQHDERRACLERAVSRVTITACDPHAVEVRCAAGDAPH